MNEKQTTCQWCHSVEPPVKNIDTHLYCKQCRNWLYECLFCEQTNTVHIKGALFCHDCQQ